ncbi:MAG: hypothetical protein QW575_09090 [Thermoproteota archaeon]
MTLQDYLTRTQRLLHDTNNTYYTQPELIDYINEARGTVAYQTGCLRQSSFTSITASTSTISYPTNFIDVWKIYLTLANWTYPMQHLPYSEFRKQAYNTTMIGRPIMFSTQNPTIFIYPAADQTYSVEIYGILAPTPLTDLTTPDTIPFPFTDLVPYYAAYLANLYAQRLDKSTSFLQIYKDRLSQISPSVQRIK